MTESEYKRVIKIIRDNMTILRDSLNNFPRLVLTQQGFSKVKHELKTLVKGD